MAKGPESASLGPQKVVRLNQGGAMHIVLGLGFLVGHLHF